MPGTLLILGSARCLWDDLRAFGDADFAGDRMAINMTGVVYARKLRHWVTQHPDKMASYRYLREVMARDLNILESLICHADEAAPGVDQVSGHWGAGTSALFAVKRGLELGYDRLVLAGVPLDGSGHFYDDPAAPTPDLYNHGANIDPFLLKRWKKHLPDMAGRVTSLSGRTRALLGAPDLSTIERNAA